jgi:two-component system nitrate/nitrite response regulator NarL
MLEAVQDDAVPSEGRLARPPRKSVSGRSAGRRTARRPDPVRTIVCDADPMARRVIRDALQGAGLTVIADAATGAEVVGLATHYRPDVVLLDALARGFDPLRSTRQIVDRAPEVKVLMLTITDDLELGFAALRAGARGFVSKDIEPNAIADVVKRVAAGEAVISPQLTSHLIERVRALPDSGLGIRPVRSSLTSREWEVLDLLCAGRGTDTIAEELVLSVETVRSHVKSVLRKLGVHSQAEAIAEAHRLRVPPSGPPDEHGPE